MSAKPVDGVIIEAKTRPLIVGTNYAGTDARYLEIKPENPPAHDNERVSPTWQAYVLGANFDAFEVRVISQALDLTDGAVKDALFGIAYRRGTLSKRQVERYRNAWVDETGEVSTHDWQKFEVEERERAYLEASARSRPFRLFVPPGSRH